MARVGALSRVAILDTSWLLEFYRVPGYFEGSRTPQVRQQARELDKAEYKLFVTVPVLFEVANHITHVRDGHRRRALSKGLLENITSSFDENAPWTVVTVGREILLRSEDVIRLADRFLEETGPNYSFANISIIDLADKLRQPERPVKILTFNDRIGAYSD